MMIILAVTAAVIEEQGRYLIAQRKKDSHQGLRWEFPGGKVESGESPEICLGREIKEELNVNIEVGDIFKVISHIYEDKQVILLCYKCKILSGTPRPIECEDYKWVTPEQMTGFDFAPADVPVVEALQKGE
jgi:8-oxo-dGTP diphosphatase